MFARTTKQRSVFKKVFPTARTPQLLIDDAGNAYSPATNAENEPFAAISIGDASETLHTISGPSVTAFTSALEAEGIDEFDPHSSPLSRQGWYQHHSPHGHGAFVARFDLGSRDVRDAFAQVGACVGTDTFNAGARMLTGVRMRVTEETEVELAATDRYSLAILNAPVHETSREAFEVVIDGRLIALASTSGGELTVYESAAVLTTHGLTVTIGTLPADAYPSVDRLFARDMHTLVSLTRGVDGLVSAIETARRQAVMVEGETETDIDPDVVTVSFDDDVLVWAANGEAVEVPDVESALGQELTYLFDRRRITRLLKALRRHTHLQLAVPTDAGEQHSPRKAMRVNTWNGSFLLMPVVRNDVFLLPRTRTDYAAGQRRRAVIRAKAETTSDEETAGAGHGRQ